MSAQGADQVVLFATAPQAAAMIPPCFLGSGVDWVARAEGVRVVE